MDNSKTELFESMPIPKAVVTLSVPSVISSLVMVIYSLADTFFVGMMNDPVQNAAVTLAAPLLLAFNAVNNLFGIGSSSMMSRALGRKDYDTVYRSSAFGFYASLICSLLFSLLYGVLQSPILVMLGANAETMQATADYLFWTVLLGSAPSILNVVLAYLVRAEGSSLHASIGTMCGCLLNIVLDPIFILPWGLNLGAAGAGCATCLSNTVACLYFFVLLFVKRGKTYVCIKPSMFRPSKQIVKGVCGVGIPASIQNLLNVTGMTILNNFTSAYGSDPVAAMGIAQRVNIVPFQIAMGFSQGIMPLISYNYTSGNIKRMKKTFMFTAKISLGFILAVMLTFHVHEEREHRRVRRGVPARLLLCAAVLVHRFPRAGRVPVVRYGYEIVHIRCCAQDRAGDSRVVCAELAVPAVWPRVCAVRRRADPRHHRRCRARENVPQARKRTCRTVCERFGKREIRFEKGTVCTPFLFAYTENNA